ncbi:hypothetical protein BG011_007422 [Mortierella polycephala]|uniref:DUF155 domain-containing protein n=1 Tax=Mortierella polycephala TaxID=41804 RepID=A0A9P6PSF2_9FUNG|nr:hypothetical protein BG011_007422 [Mortierella polycephala]
MSHSNVSYQPIPDSAGPLLPISNDMHTDPSSLTSHSNNPKNGITGGNAGIPPKIINPTKQVFAQQTHHKLPIHQIPGATNVAAKMNMASTVAGGATGGIGAIGVTGSARPTGATTAHNLPTGANAGVAGGPGNAGMNLRGKVKQPMRTTKTSQKLTLFPEEKDVPVLEDEYAFDDTTYNQIGQLSSGIQKLPRVIAYCTASAYRMDDLFNYLQSRKIANNAAPKLLDECIYTPYSYNVTSKPPTTGDHLGLDEATTYESRHQAQQQLKESTPEVFYFDYGVVVIWGMSEKEESRLLQELSSFEEEKLGDEDVETEEFSYHYNSQYQPRIYNDVITLKSAGNYMVKLTISHAIAQSVKMTLFEGLIENTINATKHIPQTMAETGKVPLSRTAITKKMGQLFIMRINVNLVSNILDTPEIFWSEPSFQPLYSAIRGYLEIGQRVELLNQRTAVISDLLDMLKEHLTSSHGEQLEWIVIILIFLEIVIGLITIAAAGLAEKYKEKAQARKRGAGTHQPKFRGFSLTKSVLETASANTTTVTGNELSTTTIAKTAVSASTTTVAQKVTKTTRAVETTRTEAETEVQTQSIKTQPNRAISSIKPAAATANGTGLNEKYQERFKTRSRGAGTHQPDFRGFSLKSTKGSEQSKGPEQSGRRRSARHTVIGVLATSEQEQAPQEDEETPIPTSTASNSRSGTTPRSKSAPNTQDEPLSKSRDSLAKERKTPSIRKIAAKDNAPAGSSSASDSQRSKTDIGFPVLHRVLTKKSKKNRTTESVHDRTSERSADSIPQTPNPNSRASRSASRQSGVSPGFKITWGKNTTILTSESGGRSKGDSSKAKDTTSTSRPVAEDTYDDLAAGRDDEYQMPSPVHDTADHELILDSQDLASNRDTNQKKRKSSAMPTSDTTVISGNRNATLGKRRRIIQEEVDENQDPLPVHEKRATNQAKVTDSDKKKKSRTSEAQSKSKGLVDIGQDTISKSSNDAHRSKAGKSAKAMARKEGAKPLRQATLAQLVPKPTEKEHDKKTSASASRRSDPIIDTDESDSDFMANKSRSSAINTSTGLGDRKMKKKSASKGSKGPSDRAVQTYKQLQIHCLKMWGPSTFISRPETAGKRIKGKQASVKGKESADEDATASRKLVQGVLQIDDAPLSEMDVIAEAVRDVVDNFIDTIEDQAMVKEMLTLRSDLETVLIEQVGVNCLAHDYVQVDMLDDHSLLRASVKKAAAVKKELRAQLLETQRRRQRTREELKRVRASFEREERARRRLEETHKFLTDLEALRDEVSRSDDEDDDGQTVSSEDENVKTGLQSLIATVGSRCGGAGSTANNETQPGMLGALVEFNQLLETVEKSVRSMPLITPSQKVTTPRRRDSEEDSDDSDI